MRLCSFPRLAHASPSTPFVIVPYLA